MTDELVRPSRSMSAIAGTPPTPSRSAFGKWGLRIAVAVEEPHLAVSPTSRPPARDGDVRLPVAVDIADHRRRVALPPARPGPGPARENSPVALPDVERVVRLHDDLGNAVAVEVAERGRCTRSGWSSAAGIGSLRPSRSPPAPSTAGGPLGGYATSTISGAPSPSTSPIDGERVGRNPLVDQNREARERSFPSRW